MIKLTPEQKQLAEDLGWNSPDMLTESIKRLIIHIDKKFSQKLTRQDLTIPIYPPQNKAATRQMFYALGNQSALEVTRSFHYGFFSYDSNYERFNLNAMYRNALYDVLKKMADTDKIEVFSYVDGIVNDYAATPKNILFQANAQNDVFLTSESFGSNSGNLIKPFNELFDDYRHFTQRTQVNNTTVISHFYMTNPETLKTIKAHPETANEMYAIGRIREYRKFFLTPNSVMLTETEHPRKEAREKVAAGA